MRERGRASLIFVILGAALAAGGVAAGISVVMLRRAVANESTARGEEKREVVPIKFLYSLGELTVNLQEPGRYLRAGVELEVLAKGSPQSNPSEKAETSHSSEKEGEEGPSLPPLAAATKEELDAKRAKVLDATINELSSSSFRSLLTSEGKQELKARIRDAINPLLESGEVEEVYFTSFLVQ